MKVILVVSLIGVLAIAVPVLVGIGVHMKTKYY